MAQLNAVARKMIGAFCPHVSPVNPTGGSTFTGVLLIVILKGGELCVPPHVLDTDPNTDMVVPVFVPGNGSSVIDLVVWLICVGPLCVPFPRHPAGMLKIYLSTSFRAGSPAPPVPATYKGSTQRVATPGLHRGISLFKTELHVPVVGQAKPKTLCLV